MRYLNCLQLHQLPIYAVPLHQFGMSALFTYLPSLYDIDHVRFLYGGEPMGHHQRGAASHKRFNAFLDQLLTLRIQGGGRLIQKQYRRVSDERAGYGDPLTLPAGQAFAPLSHQRVIPLWKGHDKLMGIGPPGRLLHLLVAGIQPSISYVLPYACGKQIGILRNIRNVSPQFIRGISCQRFPKHSDSAALQRVKTQQKLHHRTLASAALPHKRSCLSPVHRNIHTVQRPFRTVIGKYGVADLNAAVPVEEKPSAFPQESMCISDEGKRSSESEG